MTLSKPRGILFDKDGTLLDYHATWMPANRAVALELAEGDEDLAARLLMAGGWDPAVDRIVSGSPLAAGDLDDIARLWLPSLPRPRPVEAVIEFLDEAFPRYMEPTAVCPLADLMDVLRDMDLALGVATADSRNGLQKSLEPFDVMDRFVFMAGFDSGHGRKPGAGMVHGFCDAAGIAPDTVWVVGDNRHDMEMAANAGATGIGVLTGTSDLAELTAAGAATVLASVADLPARIG
ncbi:MAG: HAD family hydrolase [Alphaproteobacteria bacterium]|nr:HAD family hydrolase [Alphaproteobacteria bacterium]